jgi:hypothetical protein
MRFFVTSALLLAATSAEAVTVYTDRAAWLAAVTGTVVTDDFEENASGQYTSYGATYPGAGFSISTDNALIFTIDPDFDPLYDWGSGDVLDLERGFTTITAGADFGFDFGNPEIIFGSGVVSIDGDGIDVDAVLVGQPTFNFFGVVGATGPITINWNGGLGIIDNFSVASGTAGIPEPATWALMIAGFGLVGAAARRRRPLAA